jgi:hypothetical protein
VHREVVVKSKTTILVFSWFHRAARISKGQGYQGFLRKRAGKFASYKEKLEKRTEFHSI